MFEDSRILTTHAKCVCIQAEQCRQHHPVWKPGGDTHLPAGSMCGFGGMHQVSHAGHDLHENLL